MRILKAIIDGIKEIYIQTRRHEEMCREFSKTLSVSKEFIHRPMGD